MEQTKRLSELIGDIYDAALDPALWRDTLAGIAGFVGGQSAGLFSKDSVSKAANAYFTFGCDHHYLQLYLEDYWKFDPLASLSVFDVAQIASTADFMPYDEYCETRIHREWGQPQGYVDSVSVVLDKSVTGVACLSILRSDASGRVDQDTRRRMGLLVPHLRRAVLVGKTIDLGKAEAATLADTLDGLSASLFLVDAIGNIVHANAAANVLLSETDFLRSVGNRLVAADREINGLLQSAFMTAGVGDAAIGVKGISLPLTGRKGESYVAHVLPLTSGARRRAGNTYAATAAIFVYKAALAPTTPPALIARRFKLTPTELRVLLAIVEVGGIPDVAETLGIAGSTVKSHLGRLYEKTGARRHADLVKLVAGFSNSFLP
jgi:DNA-binding CsgD family transcriptional regulator